MATPEPKAQPRPLIRVLRSAALILVLSWLGLTVLLWVGQERIIFPATRGEISNTPDKWRMPFHRHLLETADGEQIDVWWMPQTNQDPQTQTILFCHGNAGNLGHRMDTFRALHLAGYAVLAFDYRGYGISTGSPSERGLYLDGERVWAFAVDELELQPSTIVIHGRSLGGGVASYLAERYQPSGLILESTFTRLTDVASQRFPFLPVRSIARHHFPTIERLPQIHCPLLIIHGRIDRTIPFHHGEALYSAATDSKTMLTLDTDHNSWAFEGDRWINAITEFMADLPR